MRGDILTSDGPMSTCIGLHENKMKKHIYIHFPAWRKWNAAEFAALFVNIADTANVMGAEALKTI